MPTISLIITIAPYKVPFRTGQSLLFNGFQCVFLAVIDFDCFIHSRKVTFAKEVSDLIVRLEIEECTVAFE